MIDIMKLVLSVLDLIVRVLSLLKVRREKDQ